MSKNCPKCALENNDSAKFCKGCGFDVRALVAVEKPPGTASLICGKCQSTHGPGVKFCKSCGASTAVDFSVLVASAAPDVLAEPAYVPVPVAPPAVLPVQPPVTPQLQTTSTLVATAASLPLSGSSTALPPRQKKSLSPLVLGGLALACVGLVGGSYWLMTAGGHESSAASSPEAANAPVGISTPPPKKPAVEAVSGSASVAVPASSPTLPLPALIAAPPAAPEAARATQAAAAAPVPAPAPVSAVKQAPAPEILPAARNNAEVEAKPVLKREQRAADEAVMAQRLSRQAIAIQKERDKATLSHANKTLDDLLK